MESGEEEEHGNRIKNSIWEALRSSHRGEPPENSPPVHTPNGPPFPPNLNVVRVAGPGGGKGGGGSASGGGFSGKGDWDRSNLGKICRRQRKYARGSINM